MSVRSGPCALSALVACAVLAVAAVANAQEEGTTPGAIPNPGSYQGSMQLQQQERQQYQMQQQQNQQMQQRLNQNYNQNAPGSGAQGSAGGGGGEAIDWWSKPPLPPAQNRLLGRWKQVVSQGVSSQEMPGLFGDVSKLVTGSLAGGCKSMFGSGVIAFEPNSLQWVAPDGHEELLNHVAYRADGAGVVMVSRDPGAIPALIFGFPNNDHAVVAAFNCAMDRVGAKSPAQSASTGPMAAPPSGPANALLRFQVGVAAPGSFAPLAGVQLWVTARNPETELTTAGFGTSGDGSLVDRLSADCRIPNDCVRDWKAMTAHAVGSVHTDAAGHAQTPMIPAGTYYVIGFVPYQGKPLLWNRQVNVQTGPNVVTLDQTNGSQSR